MQTERPETSRPEVLVIDDELFFAVRIETTLKKLGYEVKVIGNREEAIAQAERHPPGLVIINFGRDSLTPVETVRRLKALPHPAPVLGFLSHIHIPQVRPSAMSAGCDLLVANSALSLRLPQLVAKLAPLDGSEICVEEAAQLAEEGEVSL